MSDRSKVTRFSSTNQPARRGHTGPVRSGLYRSTAHDTPVPRGYDDQRRRKARAYLAYVTAMLQRIGQLPAAAMPTLREAGRVVVELDELATVAEAKTGLALRRVRRRQTILRTQLVRLEQRVAWWAGERKPLDLARAIAEAQANGGHA